MLKYIGYYAELPLGLPKGIEDHITSRIHQDFFTNGWCGGGGTILVLPCMVIGNGLEGGVGGWSGRMGWEEGWEGGVGGWVGWEDGWEGGVRGWSGRMEWEDRVGGWGTKTGME